MTRGSLSNKTKINWMTENHLGISHTRHKDENYPNGIEDHLLNSETIFLTDDLKDNYNDNSHFNFKQLYINRSIA